MERTIGNPISWLAKSLGLTGAHVSASVDHLGSDKIASMPKVLQLDFADLRAALRAGWHDFGACRSDAIALVFLYPLIGIALVVLSLSMNLLPLIFPLILGFSLIGPVAAVGLYEMSARREAGFTPSWMDAFSVLRSPAFLSILALGIYLAALAVLWLMIAAAIYNRTLGPEAPQSFAVFAQDIFMTAPGWAMLLIGGAVGGLFAFVALAVSLVSFPLLLDRHVGLPIAVATSLRVVRQNTVVTLTWGAIVALSLLLAAIPMFAGMIIVVPVLGHATWHLYRRAVA
ncbi:DUF2189 domain-containing protein [Phaeobacter porticola]|uniref:Putative integral membrane protein n=1 Tax=Phaeobacter porticola TaxID=1844006 RepID=A0A1L3I1D0_9RHOB|nr:DUF2189 domain-containing protein [Phaeobacter porticola]APG45920.1 putative integral membrane protein [Phaeobacter porticola]